MAGVLLLHMSEEQAFEMLKFLMYDLGFRKQYRPDMMSLQVRQFILISQVCKRRSSEISVPAISESDFREFGQIFRYVLVIVVGEDLIFC